MNVNDRCSKLAIKEFPIKYKHFLTWHDYDGKESIEINYESYLIHCIKCVKDTDMTSDEKMKHIQALYDEYELK